MLHITTSHSASAGVNANGNVWAWPAGATRPQYAVVANPPSGSVADNTAIVTVGTAGQIAFYNGAGGTAVDVRADIEGYVTSADTSATGAAFAPLPPGRIINTADGTGGRSRPLTSKAAWTFHTLGVGGIPASGVSAVALNLGAQQTSTNCWVQVQPAGTGKSDSAYPRVDTYANYTAQELAVVAPDTSGNITFSTNCASTDLYVDVEGYYLVPTDESSGDVYVPITDPTRVVDTRHDVGIAGKMTSGRVVNGAKAIGVSGVGEVPSDADAVALSIATVNANKRGYNTIWTDGTTRPSSTSTIDVDPHVVESNLVFVQTGARGKIDVADPSRADTESNDLYVDIEGYFYRPASGVAFATPQYFPNVIGDTFYNTVGPAGDILATTNDASGVNGSCTRAGSDIALLAVRGSDPARLSVSTVNCMKGYGTRAGGPNTPDGCSWKSGGITRVGRVIYLAVARQLKSCSKGLEANGLQPSFNASIVKSVDGGKTWTNPWGQTARDGAAPPYLSAQHRYKAMFPGQTFSAPFFIQYGPGNTQTADGADKYLYTVSNDGYAYDGNYLHLARVPLNKIQKAGAWQFYHGRVGGAGTNWSSSVAGATRVLQAKHSLSQPAIQYLPTLHEYVMATFSFTQGASDFPNPDETPYTQFVFYTAPKPWGPWTKTYDHPGQRSLWCPASPCQLTAHPNTASLTVGTPDDWLGLYDQSIVQKFVFTRPLAEQAVFTGGDWKRTTRYSGQALYRLYVIPLNLTAVVQQQP
jgi:hypothetical protein